ncbi:site-specific integrase [Roseateles sp. DAIF2]|uniref:gamma-mobile-trio recombinase GmtY n=1 Tax=Roseateles sp. DAIF2 TaxID=2714952 RepID=UPI0018A2EC27|nr:gamma-mobile-trio recombinase GmtY [Roseateles sp. DAIF2]QPF72247.1 site-specific integrase [Roseateles sp. DAIF2]
MFVSIKVKVLVDSAGPGIDMPALLTPVGLLRPLLDYFVAEQHKSLSWMRKVTHSVQLFLEYMHANPSEVDTRVLFANFARRLYTGTFDLQTRADPSGLCWAPRSISDASRIISDLNLFLDWQGERQPAALSVNPRVSASRYEKQWLDAATRYRRENALLGHLWSRRDEASVSSSRQVRAKRGPHSRDGEPPAFPEGEFMNLLTDGFRVGKRIDYRGQLITLLLHGAGFRESEPFHLYIEDVAHDPINPGAALVRIHHPSAGHAPSSWRGNLKKNKRGTRAEYLMDEFGLKPRNQNFDNSHAGWKGGLCDAPYYMEARWFEAQYGTIFMDAWLRYLHQISRIDRNHPFAFVNLGRGRLGDPYKVSQFNDAHAAACRRIGLNVRKDLGTTPHGHRHAYGRRLVKAGMNQKYIRIFMHHASIESQAVYTQPTSAEVAEALQSSMDRLAASSAERLRKRQASE